jgi:hypothetical protein
MAAQEYEQLALHDGAGWLITPFVLERFCHANGSRRFFRG